MHDFNIDLVRTVYINELNKFIHLIACYELREQYQFMHILQ